MSGPALRGGCFCAAVRYELEGSLHSARACHCSKCRKAFSGASSAYAELAPDGKLRWLSGEDVLRVYETGGGWGMAFCSRCGSTLCGMHEGRVHGLTLGCVDGDPGVEIERHIFVDSKAPWDHIGGDAPRYAEHAPSEEGGGVKVTYYAGASLDGYIARPDGDVSWLESFAIPPEANGYERFFASVDGLVMGRRTHDMLRGFGTWPYGDKPAWVCSSSRVERLAGANLQPQVDPGQVVDRARSEGIRHLWLVGGGVLASAFLARKLLTHVVLTQIPILLGDGIPLFAALPDPAPLRLLRTRGAEHGFIESEFEVADASARDARS